VLTCEISLYRWGILGRRDKVRGKSWSNLLTDRMIGVEGTKPTLLDIDQDYLFPAGRNGLFY